MPFLFVLLAVGVGWFALRWALNSHTLCKLVVTDGELEIVSGGLPGRLVRDIRDVVSRPPVAQGLVSIVQDGTGARVTVRGDLDERHAQRLRNCLRLYTVAQIRKAPVVPAPTLRSVGLIAWITWLLLG